MKTVDKFVDEIQKFLESNLLSSGKIIRDFLIFVAKDEICKEILFSVCKEFQFDDEYKRVFTDGYPLPKVDSKVVALVTVTLFYIDTGKQSLSDLLSMRYRGLSGKEAYDKFLCEIIKPYAESFVKLMSEEPTEEINDKKPTVYDKMNEDITAVIKEIAEIVLGIRLPEEDKDIILNALSSITYSLQYNDVILTRYAYRAYQNVLRLFNISTDMDEDLNRILRLYGVL